MLLLWYVKLLVAPPGAFPREADRAFGVSVTHGGRAPHARVLYSGSGLFRGYIARFVKKSSRPRRNFASAREIHCDHDPEWQIRRKSRYGESKMEISEKLPPRWLWPERALEMNVAPWPGGHLIFWPIWRIRLQKKVRSKILDFFRYENFESWNLEILKSEIWKFWNLRSENFETWNLKILKSGIWKFWNLKSETFEIWNLKFLKSEIWKFRPNSFFWRRFFLKTANLLLFT